MTSCGVKTVRVVDWFLVKGNGTFRNDSTSGDFGGNKPSKYNKVIIKIYKHFQSKPSRLSRIKIG